MCAIMEGCPNGLAVIEQQQREEGHIENRYIFHESNMEEVKGLTEHLGQCMP